MKNIFSVNISTTTGSVQISPSKDDKIRVQLADGMLSKHYKLKMKEKNNQVFIKAKKKSSFLSFNKAQLDFTILVELPIKEYEQIHVRAGVAAIDIQHIQANQFVLETEVGNINVADSQGTIEAKTDVGDITLQVQNVLNNITAQARVGNVTVKTIEVPIALQTKLEYSIGNEILNLPDMKKGSIGKGGPLVDLSTEVGDVALLLSDE